jgi:hypothetical protein
MGAINIITSANFRPGWYSFDMEEKLRKIAQMYWAIEAAKDVVNEQKTHTAALVLQELQQQRKELIKTLPLMAV